MMSLSSAMVDKPKTVKVGDTNNVNQNHHHNLAKTQILTEKSDSIPRRAKVEFSKNRNAKGIKRYQQLSLID